MIAWPDLFSRGGLRAVTCLTAGWMSLVAVSEVAHANPRADELSQEAGDLLFATPPNYDAAIDKYQQAIVLAPEGRFYFNLCVAYYESGRYGLALQACDAVAVVGADEKVTKKTASVLALVEKQLRAMGLDPDPLRKQIADSTGGDGGTGGDGTGGDGTGGDGTGGDGGDGTGTTGGGGGDGTGGGGGGGQVDLNQITAPKPTESLFATKPLSHDYTWTVGGSLFAASSTVGGDMFGSGGGGFRGWVDYIVSPERKVGLQGHIGFTNIAPADGSDESLSIVEFGGSVYAHVKCVGRMCITPLAGISLAGMQPSSLGEEVRMATFGVRAEGTVSFAFGPRWQHVLTVTPALNIYLPAFGSYDNGLDPASFGLDQAGTTFALGVGYTRRFDTPFGQAPFITLE